MMIVPGQLLPIIIAPHHEKRRPSCKVGAAHARLQRAFVAAAARAAQSCALLLLLLQLLRNLLQCVPDVGRERTFVSLTSDNRRNIRQKSAT